MNNEIILSADVPTFPVNMIKLEELRVKCFAIKVCGIDDLEGFKVADRARMDVKADRCAVQNRQKDLKKQIKEWGEKNIDVPAEALIAELAKIEKYLEEQTSPVEAERKRIKLESEEKKKREAEEKLASRVAALVACRAVKNPIEIAALSDVAFADLLDYCQKEDATRRDQEAADKKKRESDAVELAELRKLKAQQAKVLENQFAAAQIIPAQVIAAATNCIPSPPSTALPYPMPRSVPLADVGDLRRSRDLRRLCEFADFVAREVKVPEVKTEELHAVRESIAQVLRDAAVEIREIISDCESDESGQPSNELVGAGIDDI